MKRLLFIFVLLITLTACGSNDESTYGKLNDSDDFSCQNDMCLYEDIYYHTAITYLEGDDFMELLYPFDYVNTNFNHTSTTKVFLSIEYNFSLNELSYYDILTPTTKITCDITSECEILFDELSENMYDELLEAIGKIDSAIN